MPTRSHLWVKGFNRTVILICAKSVCLRSDQSRANHQLLQLCTVRTAWSDSDQALRAMHSCKSWFGIDFYGKLCFFFYKFLHAFSFSSLLKICVKNLIINS